MTPMMQELISDPKCVAQVSVGDVVRCGPVGAVWRVIDENRDGGKVTFLLDPMDPHDVPLSAKVRELPMPGAVL